MIKGLQKNRVRNLAFLGGALLLVGCTNITEQKQSDYSLLKGINLAQQGKYSEAIQELTKSYNSNPNNLVLLKELGYVFYKSGNYNKAEQYWLEGLKLSSNDEDLIKNISTLYFQEGKYSKVLEMIGKSSNQQDSYYTKLKALIYEKTDVNKAYNTLKSLKLEDFDVSTAIEYINILKELKKKQELYTFLKESYTKFSTDKNYITTYAKTLSEVFSQNKEAETTLLNYIIKNGSDNDIYSQLANLYLKSGDKSKAEDTLKLIFQK